MARKPVKIFLDSNVIISGIFSDKGSPRIILDILCLDFPFIVGATGKYNIIEIERNLKRKMPRAFSVYQEYFPNLNLEIISLPTKKEIEANLEHTSDKDVPVLVSAIKGKADFLITGDKKDFSKLKLRNDLDLKILNPSEFLDIFRRLHESFQSE
jgi:putative PIN family toxin of toxin-antitoxin system